MAKFPDFVVVGQTKTCTTSLWYNLDNHPDITMCSQENDSEILTGTEITFWGSRNFGKGIEWYKSLFQGKVAGEKSPGYINRAQCFKQMSRHMPDVKLVLCIRNPVDRAYSQFQMRQRRNPVTKAPSYQELEQSSEKGRYYTLITNNVLPYFPRGQLHLCVAEWMRHDPNAEIQKVYDFLGIGHHSLPNVRLESSIAHGKGKPKVEVKRSDDYKEWHNEYPKLPARMRAKLLKLFEKDNNRLFSFLGYEIPEWSK